VIATSGQPNFLERLWKSSTRHGWRGSPSPSPQPSPPRRGGNHRQRLKTGDLRSGRGRLGHSLSPRERVGVRIPRRIRALNPRTGRRQERRALLGQRVRHTYRAEQCSALRFMERGKRSTVGRRGHSLLGTAIAACWRALKAQIRQSLLTPAPSFVLCCLFIVLTLLPAPAAEPAATTRFQAIHVYLEAQAEPLAAYQIFLRATKGDVKIVGIEGGEPVAFKQPPFYDPKAFQQERVILAAFSTRPKAELPTGKIRVATVHLQVTGDAEPEFETKLQAAANHDGKKISPTISLDPVKP
jgi:hypothetical protein